MHSRLLSEKEEDILQSKAEFNNAIDSFPHADGMDINIVFTSILPARRLKSLSYKQLMIHSKALIPKRITR